MVMTILRSMDVKEDRLLLQACWPEGTSFRYRIGRSGIVVEGFPWLRAGTTRRRRLRRLVVVEGPANTLTLLLHESPPRWKQRGQRLVRYLTGQYSPLPLDDNEVGTAWGTVDSASLLRELERLGIPVHRTTWDAYLPEV